MGKVDFLDLASPLANIGAGHTLPLALVNALHSDGVASGVVGKLKGRIVGVKSIAGEPIAELLFGGGRSGRSSILGIRRVGPQ
jgi:hypothetical protein